MQTVEKQVVLEENWQVLAVVFPPFAQRLGITGLLARSMLGVFHSSHGLLLPDYIDKRTGNQIWDPESAEPRSTSPFTG